MKLATCGLLLLAMQVAFAGLEKFSDFVVADKDPHTQAPTDAIRVTYLGVNGYQFETDGHALLVDPYFTRVGFWSAALNQQIESDPDRVTEGLKHVRSHVDAVLITHAHFDHLLDAPEIMRRTHARLIAGPTAIRLAESLGISASGCETVKSGSTRQIGPWTIRVFAAQHDRLLGKVPFAGKLRSSKPRKPSEWVVGEPLAFVIEASGKRIYIDSGGVPGTPPTARIHDVGHGKSARWRIDLAILGVALPDSRRRFAEAVRQLQPGYILPSHQDDMFAAFSRGFTFGKLTNFPQLVRTHEKQQLPGRLILLDYFRPWTLL